METMQLLEEAKKLLSDLATAVTQPEENRIDVIIPREKLVKAADLLENCGWGYLSAITGLDHSASNLIKSEEKQWEHVVDGSGQTGFGYTGLLEVLYHFCSGAAITTLRVQVGHDSPVIPSICKIIPSATLYEREVMEMFGVEIEGTPDKEHLLLPDDWPAGVYPLRKDFQGFDTDMNGKGTDNA